MPKFRKKPVVIEAFQWLPNNEYAAGRCAGWMEAGGCDFTVGGRMMPLTNPVRLIRGFAGETKAIPYDSLDDGIRETVRVLAEGGVETFESCQGGEGHAYPEPTVRFFGQREGGWKALAVAQAVRLEVLELRRVWPINDGEPTGPWWEMTFRATGQ